MATPLFETSIKSLPLLGRGKVRDIYAVDDATLLIVTSDRLSAFDVILPDPIPDKGRVLVALANFWFDKLGHILPNQLTGIDPETVVAADERDQVRGRALVVKRLTPLPIEAVVRGYVIGSGWKDYQATGAICGIATLTPLDMATSKLLANSDRCMDDGVFSRDLIDLAMMAPPLPLLHQAVVKAEQAYGASVCHDLDKAIARMRERQGRLERCMKALDMNMPRALLWQKIRALRRVLPS